MRAIATVLILMGASFPIRLCDQSRFAMGFVDGG
jgi:hypothetical protein